MKNSLADCQRQVDDWIHQVGVRYFSEMTNTVILVEEVGELARWVARRYGEQSFKPGEKREDPGEELADILFVLLCLANQFGIDMETAFEQSLEKKRQRDKDRHKNNPKLTEGDPLPPE